MNSPKTSLTAESGDSVASSSLEEATTTLSVCGAATTFDAEDEAFFDLDEATFAGGAPVDASGAAGADDSDLRAFGILCTMIISLF